MNKNRIKINWRLISAPLAVAALLLAAFGLAKAGVLVPPQRVDVEPGPGVHTAPVDTSVSITYDQDMDPATVDAQSFAVHARQSGWLTETLSVDGGTITLDPLNDLHAGELVQASATTNLLSLGGEAPLTSTVWQFTTAPWGGNAAFHEHQILSGVDSRDAALGDLDGDGDLDAFTTSCFSNLHRVYRNDGSGTFSLVQTFSFNTCFLDVELGDLDGDGDLDAILIDHWMVGSKVLWNNGDGIFTNSGQSVGMDDCYGELGDLDGDGDLDYFVTAGGFGENTLQVWQNDGAGIFTLIDDFDSAYEHMDVRLGDLDGDYDLDAFTTGWNDSYNKVWLNDGAGNFNEVQSIPNAHASGVQLGDLDGDGDLDAYLANTAFDVTDLPDQVWLNNGAGHFTNSGQSLDTVLSAFPALGDLDADGDLDVYLSGEPETAAPDEVWANDGTGMLTLFRTVAENHPGGGASLGDLDGDGNLDALTASKFSPYSYQVYLNGDWTQAEPIPHITSLSATIRCPDDPNRFYLLGGYEAWGSALDHFRRYDTATNQWENLAPFPYPVSTPAAACHAGKIYAAIWWDLYIYDIATNTWTEGPPPPRRIEAAGSGVWNGSLYVVGSGAPLDGRISRYDFATETWTLSIGTMPNPVDYAGWAQVGPYLYAVGGRKSDMVNVVDTYRYDMSTNTWERGPDLASPRWAVGAVATGSRLYALGGAYQWGTSLYDEVYYQDLSTWPADEWTEYLDPLPLAYGGMSTACSEAVAGGEIWSTGGSYEDEHGGHVLDTNLYHPAEPCILAVYALALAPGSDSREGYPGQEVIYNLTLTNTGESPDAYDLELISAWSAQVDWTPGALDPGESRLVTVTVQVPEDVMAGEMDLATITITSQGDSAQSAQTALTTTALPVFAPEFEPDNLALSGRPGQTLTYNLQLSNQGNLTDTYTLSATGNTWILLLPATQLTLGAGEAAEVSVHVIVPEDALAGAVDVATLIATSQGDPGQSTTAVLTTSAEAAYGLKLAVEMDELAGMPGETVTYTLMISNQGNITDTYDLDCLGDEWPMELPTEVITLAVGESANVVVIVHIPLEARPGEWDAMTFTAVSQGDVNEASSAELTTSVTGNLSFLPVIQLTQE